MTFNILFNNLEEKNALNTEFTIFFSVLLGTKQKISKSMKQKNRKVFTQFMLKCKRLNFVFSFHLQMKSEVRDSFPLLHYFSQFKHSAN